MRAALQTTVIAAAVAVTGAPPAAAKPPTQRQIARAVARAERSGSLWATINICNSRRFPENVGVRGQMPSLGFSSTMTLRIQLNSWSTTDKRFEPIASPNALNVVSLGSHSNGLEQSGARFPFVKGTKGLWNATIVFQWRRGGRLIGETHRRTTAGHHDADFASPPHYSAARCLIS